MQKIIDYLKQHGTIDDDAVAYHPELFPFTLEEFREYTESLYDPNTAPEVEGTYFETHNVPFEWEGDKFNLVVMYGQGSAWTLMTREACDEWLKRVLELSAKLRAEDEKQNGN